MRAKQRVTSAEAGIGITSMGKIDVYPRVEAMEEAKPKNRTKASSKKKK